CVDLAEESGDVYDVVFFISGKPGDMTVTEKSVHKENGKPFYTWRQQKDKTWKQVPVEASENRLMGVVEGEDTFTFHYEVTLPEIKSTAEIWIPVARSDPWQEVELLSTTPKDRGSFKTEVEFGNQYVHFALDEADSEKTIRLDYAVKRTEKGPYSETDVNPKEYLKSTELLPVGGRFESIVNDILATKRGDSDLMKARAIYDYIVDTVRYRKVGQYGTGDANYACDSRSGNCTEFHSYFISLAKSASIPARFAIGAAIPSERNEGGVNGYHCWAEFYADSKWWPIDISEGNKYAALSTYYFGHHPANRIEFSRGRDLRLSPLPASGAIPFFAYPVFEKNGTPQKVKTRFTFEREVI
ncbi:MAG: transglutaminase domain-containing protein, partial [Cryomorphaceae bacterium]